MNSKLMTFLLLFSAIACGVKGDPIPPQGSNIPSFMENYPDIKLATPIKSSHKRYKKK